MKPLPLPVLLLLVLFSLSSISASFAAGSSPKTSPKPVFQPTDSILLNCGSSDDGTTDSDGRTWSAETDANEYYTSGNTTTAVAEFQDPSLSSPVPYMTARLFMAPSTYSFPVSRGDRHWVRLHFYPAAYNNLNANTSFFSITTSTGLTLLNNFSAAITAQALTQAYIIKEFSLGASEDGFLNLTFTPSEKYDNSYAFINGIEIISMPDIYNNSAILVGFGEETDITSTGLQTMYRVNVGGQYIPPVNDSGLSRIWYDDSFYLLGAAQGVTSAANATTKVEFGTPEYVAPMDVYRTARTMGPTAEINKNYNLTWVFQIDKNFTYVIRMHFCDYLNNRVNERVFDVFINNETAQANVDVVAWTTQQATMTTYKDYVVSVKDGPGEDQLWVALHPSESSKAGFMDAILNGLEIFKQSDPNGNLAGPNPEPSPLMLREWLELTPSGFENASGKKTVIVVVPLACGFGLLVALCSVVLYNKRKKKAGGGASAGHSGWLPLYGNSHTSASKSTISGKSHGSSHISNMAALLSRHFSLAEILQGTRNFDESFVIGVGGFGKVYKGVVDGNTKVAIKRSNPSSEQGVHEFQTEIEMLSKLRHRHLVSLIGYCEENDEMILVYDYMAFGTLREHLYKGNKPPLTWKQRLEICIGAAKGLHYLHTGAQYPIIHRDVKTTNILLDDKWVAKVSDFGLSKTGPTMNQTHVSTVVKGSFGYLDPEYFRRQQLTDKSDVYSFGVVLFEVLCARPALNPSLSKDQVSLADWALHNQRKGTLNDIIDPVLKGKINPECLKKFADTAEKCLSDQGTERPSMGDVLWNLEFALQLEEGTQAGVPLGMEGTQRSTSADARAGSHGPTGSIGDSEVSVESSGNSIDVFSQLVNPKGR